MKPNKNIESFKEKIDQALVFGKGKFRYISARDLHDLKKIINLFETNDRKIISSIDNLDTEIRDLLPYSLLKMANYN